MPTGSDPGARRFAGLILDSGVASVVDWTGDPSADGRAERPAAPGGVPTIGLLENEAKLSAVVAPTLVVHGSDDRVVPPHQSALLHRAANKAPLSRLVSVPGRGHNDLCGSPLFWAAVEAFVGDVLGGCPMGCPPASAQTCERG